MVATRDWEHHGPLRHPSFANHSPTPSTHLDQLLDALGAAIGLPVATCGAAGTGAGIGGYQLVQ